MYQPEIAPNSPMAAEMKIATIISAMVIKAASAVQVAASYPSSIEGAEKALSSLRVWLAIFTCTVAVGLVLEYKKPLWLICKGLLRLISFRTNSFDRCVLRKLCWHFLGALLVTAGVLGEFWIEFKQFDSENRLSRAWAMDREKHEARRVTPAQSECIDNALKEFKGKNRRLRFVYWPTAESTVSMGQLGAALAKGLASSSFDVQPLDATTDHLWISQVGGDEAFSNAIDSALSCLGPEWNKRPKGNPDPNKELEIWIFPDPSRSPR